MLIPSVNVDSKTYEINYVIDYEYHGDDVFMCLDFNYADSSRGSALAKYNIKTQTTELILIDSDDFKPNSIGIVKDDFCLVFNTSRDKGYLIGNDGEILDDNFPFVNADDLSYYFTDNYIFSYGGAVSYKTWDNSDFVKIIDAGENRVSELYYNNGILSISTYRSWEHILGTGKYFITWQQAV